MSILIKGMKMPEECVVCPCFNDEYGRCMIHWDKGNPCSFQFPPSWCTMTELPKHGRLIDADALWGEIHKICNRRDAGIISDLTCLQQLLSAIRHAPTVIEAEGE